MSGWFKRLPNAQKSPAGLERLVLAQVPKVTAMGTAVLLLPGGVHRLLAQPDLPLGGSPPWAPIELLALGLVMLLWTLMLTVYIGAFIVMVMKGPAYVADAYPLQDADPPAENRPPRWP